MRDDHRPDPDALLAAVQHEESKQQRGKLKIFFGMSAGVGKTYAMLESAKQRLVDGVDVVIGYVETHKRAETEALVSGLPIIPRQKLIYKGATLEEMDIDAILERKPQLVLVDELAHTNVEGSRHPKRYQDVLELLTAGMDVYTTVNVQHLESRADTVAQITGVIVHETVPDTLIDIADEIELIDLDPDELLKRLSEGKVYTHDKVELAANNFFRKGNLNALREMALRLTAEHVDQQMQDYMQIKHIQGPWKSLDRLMVAISPSPLSERLIRWTRRTAYTLKAPWMAVYIDTLGPLNESQKVQLARNLSLVRKLGGEVVNSSGDDPAAEITRIAQQRNVTQIVVGKPAGTWFQEWFRGGSMVDRLIRLSGDIDVYVVTGDQTESTQRPTISAPTIHSNREQYIITAGVVVAAIIVSQLLAPFIGYKESALVMLFVIVLLANFVGRGPILMAAALSAFLIDYLFIPPRFSVEIKSLQDSLILGLYFIIAIVTGNLTARLATQKKLLQQREDRTLSLYRMSRQIIQAVTVEDLLEIAIQNIKLVFSADSAIFLPDEAGKLVTSKCDNDFIVDDKEFSVADWAFTHNQFAGRFTDTLPTAQAQYLPLATPGGVVGVIAVHTQNGEPFSVDQESLLQTFASHLALAIEREQLDEAAHQAQVVAESERLYATLLDSVSYELRTPLNSIDAAINTLESTEAASSQALQETTLQETIGTIKNASARLTRLVGNLFNMTRLESGHLKLNIEQSDVSDLIKASLETVNADLNEHEVIVDVDPNLPLIPMDFMLMQQVLVNLLENAATYTPKGTRVRVAAKIEDNHLMLSIADRGPGLPPQDIHRVFDKFYRIPSSGSGGNGLGLSICKGIVEAHGGTVTAENRPTYGGARFIIRLPMEGDAILH